MSYTCPTCGAVSHNPADEGQRYCGRCHQFEDDDIRHLLMQAANVVSAALSLCTYWRRPDLLRALTELSGTLVAHATQLHQLLLSRGPARQMTGDRK